MDIRTPENLGRFLHYTQVSSSMAGLLAAEFEDRRPKDKKKKPSKVSTKRKEKNLILSQNVLHFNDQGKPEGVLWDKIESQKEDSSLLKELALVRD